MIEKICNEIGITSNELIIKKLQQENKILKENAEHNDKVVDKVNWENMLLRKENQELKEQLKGQIKEYQKAVDKTMSEKIDIENNWNKLKVYIKTEIPEDVFIDTEWFVSILDKMQELEQGEE